MEIIPIVNEADEVIGSVEKQNFDKTTGQIYRTASLYLFDRQGRILIQRRADSKKTYAGKWDLAAAAGHVSFGESYRECILRETKEEIGLEISEIHESKKEFFEGADGRRRFSQVFWAIQDFSLEDLKIREEEVAEVRLVSILELKEMFENHREDFANYGGAGLANLTDFIAEK